MSSPLVKEVSKPFLVLPTNSGQSTSTPTQKSWAQQQIEKQGSSNTQTWLPSTEPIKAPQQSMKLGSMGTMELLPTDPITLKIPTQQSMKLGSMGTMELLPTDPITPVQSTQSTQVVHPVVANVQQIPAASNAATTDIQTALQSGKVDVLNDGIYETEASAFGFATPSPSMSSYAVYGAVALVALVIVWYLYKEEYF